ncbi:MAG TPA: amidohydrolase [Vicinamibacterales bacterium]|nr:amidohydrolase [Vicinamibacterales bacterium]
MTRWTWTGTAAVATLAVAAVPMLQAQQAAPDVVLVNGKIITVDDRFTIAQAVAVRGERVVAVGSSQEIARLAGPSTRRIDLRGRTVTPGFIDNHAHFMEEGVLWSVELRLDGIETRKHAIEMMRAKAKSLAPGEWVYTLGGWSPDQFTDDKRPFTRAELDAIVADRPVLLQFTRAETYLNSRAVEAIGLDKMTEPWIRRDASGHPTGVVDAGGANRVSSVIPKPTSEMVEKNSLAMIRELNASGLTASGGSCPGAVLPIFRTMAREGRLNKRFFCLVSAPMGNNPDAVTKNLPRIAELRSRLFQGDLWIDHFAYGEANYTPAHDNMVNAGGKQRPENLEQWGRVAREIAKAGLPMHAHTTLENSFDGFLDQIERINKEFPVRNLRWSLIHGEQLTASHLERMRNLGVHAAIQPRATIMGAIFNRVHGDRSNDMPPLRTIQESGVTWGFGTDTFEVNQYRPFTTLYFAVTGKMVGGTLVNRQSIDREDALIAHTKGSAFTILQEGNMGSIQPGKLADLVVLDRDYLTIPADQIKDIRVVMTMVGGRIVYEASTSSTAR